MNFKTHFQLFLRSFFLQTGWNFVKYQNIGLTFVMIPFLKECYKNKSKELPSALTRYLETFNTHPVMASFCFGALARQEKNIVANSAKEKAIEKGEWEAIKRTLSITTASIGDRLFWGALKPLTLLLALFIWLFLDVSFLEATPSLPDHVAYIVSGIVAAFVTFNAVALCVRWIGISLGFNCEPSTCFGLIRFNWNQTIYYAKRIGVFLAIGMLLFGAYHFLKDFDSFTDIQFIARLILIAAFVLCSLIARKLRIPNMYLYLAAVLIFNIIILF